MRFWTRIRIQSSLGWKICIHTIKICTYSVHRLLVTKRKIRPIGGIEPALVFSCVREPAGVDSWSRPAGHPGQEHGGARRIHGSRSRYLQPWESSGPLLILYSRRSHPSHDQEVKSNSNVGNCLFLSPVESRGSVCMYKRIYFISFFKVAVRSDTKNKKQCLEDLEGKN